jgi:hypothetical protein
MLHYLQQTKNYFSRSALVCRETKKKLSRQKQKQQKWQVIKIFTLLLTSRLSSLESHNRKHIEITLTTDVDKDN